MMSVSGVRGIVGEGMTPEVALLWSVGFGTWVKGGKVVLGRDTRPSGEMLSHAVIAGLLGAGCDVDDAGVQPTPAAALAVERRGAAGGIVITASHNPQEWNALKFVRSDGRMLSTADFTELSNLVEAGPLRSARWDKLGTLNRWKGTEEMYLAAVTGLSMLDLSRLHRKKFKVAIDCVNGAGSYLYPRLLKALGCQVEMVNCESSGIFPHPAEPLPDNLTQLGELVRTMDCDLGFAVDPDGDRLAAVNEKGNPIGEERTLAICVQAALEYKPGPVVVNSLTTQLIDDIAGEFGVECHRTKVGEANVAVGLKELGAVIGGEGNGGVMLPEMHLVRDAGVGMALLLNKLSSGKAPVSKLLSSLPNYELVKEKVPLRDWEPEPLLNKVAGFYQHDAMSRIDGLRVTTNKGWVQVRASNTEPILRVYAEAADPREARKMADEMLQHLADIQGNPE